MRIFSYVCSFFWRITKYFLKLPSYCWNLHYNFILSRFYDSPRLDHHLLHSHTPTRNVVFLVSTCVLYYCTALYGTAWFYGSRKQQSDIYLEIYDDSKMPHYMMHKYITNVLYVHRCTRYVPCILCTHQPMTRTPTSNPFGSTKHDLEPWKSCWVSSNDT